MKGADTPMPNSQWHAMSRSVIRDTANSIKRNSLMSLASVFSIMAALVVLGFFLILTINIRQATANVESGLEIKVFLKQDVTEADKTTIEQGLRSSDMVASVKFENKDEALNNFSGQLSSYYSLLSSFNAENNPMPESFVVTAKNAEDMAAIKTYAEGLSSTGIEYVKYGKNYVTALTNFDHFANLMSIVVAAVLSVIALLLIYNTIKITVFARRKEIGIMKYVGATDGYIRIPFVLEGTFLGIIAAVVALLALCSGYFFVLGFLSGNSLLSITSTLATPGAVVGQLSFFFIVYGVVIGALGSIFAIRKFLDV
ncbi:permease-like cell division protein FtsX [Eubacterium aggregans]|uniref:permease-like cell division protein FtsX n=1 Tax=Eubacterium aggregans TaxID=81409 RepID=UPI003F2C144B